MDKNKDSKEPSSEPQALTEQQISAPNEAHLVSWKRFFIEILVLISSGLLLAAAFPDLNWSYLGWIALIPLFWIVKDKRPLQAWFAGYVWGYTWSVTSFFWLREIEWFCPIGLAFILALYPAFWAILIPILRRGLLIPVEIQLAGSKREEEFRPGPLRQLIFVAVAAAWWCVIEWIRSWMGTGLPWNFLAVTQWKNIPLIQICEYTGVYGVSFLLAMVNFSAALGIAGVREGFLRGKYRRPIPLMASLMLVMVVVLVGFRLSVKYKRLSKRGVKFTASVLQGDIAQCRQATDEQASEALKQYLKLSELSVLTRPDLIIWPETAVPYPFRGGHPVCMNYRFQVRELIEKYKIPFLIGSIDFGEIPEKSELEEHPIHNSALFLDKTGEIADRFHKIHIVPFGEFVPFGDTFPWLKKMIGMGRDLTRGRSFHVINVAPDVKAGLEICFEDVFPYISRMQTNVGANVLIVLTNDAWYPTSSEPEQHLANSIFRAVENRRPMIRCGNNSCSVVIQPTGLITDTLHFDIDPQTRAKVLKPEKRGSGCCNFSIKVSKNPPRTFFTRYGNIFILICIFITGTAASWTLWSWRGKRQTRLDKFSDEITPVNDDRMTEKSPSD